MNAEGLKKLAIQLGFDDARVASLDHFPTQEVFLQQFVDLGRHGSMHWMERRLKERSHPQNLWSDAKSALVVAANYASDKDVFDDLSDTSKAYLSVYARRRDYHDQLKKKLKQLATTMANSGCEVKVFVDTAPLMEKPLAQHAGIGWQGKHTNLVSRHFGSWLFLGVLLTSIDLQPDPPEEDHCGQCRSCMDICPTQAIPSPYQLDARKCLAYLTIEYKGVIPQEFREPLGNRVFGCDDCLAICPWNKFAQQSTGEQAALHGRDLEELVQLSDAEFREMFRQTAIKRTGRDAFVRNVLVAIGNSGDQAYLKQVCRLLDDPAPVVRAHAVACLARLSRKHFDEEFIRRLPQEEDPLVLKEWGK
ncbi:MAG: tRNA epoxyqueuosine(34) reductase QueG [Alphaproteobacteria bacterium]|nr:tRNA epoxyqueuosine(34) reductase QueG [Alphaproteobacteria bacterium]